MWYLEVNFEIFRAVLIFENSNQLIFSVGLFKFKRVDPMRKAMPRAPTTKNFIKTRKCW